MTANTILDGKEIPYSEANPLPTKLMGESGNENSVQYPLSSNGDSLYFKDINTSTSTSVNWTPTVTGGDVYELLTADLMEGMTNVTSDNPKVIKLQFERIQFLSNLGFGCDTVGENFSNIKVSFLGSQGAIIPNTGIDESTDNTKRTSRIFTFENTPVSALLIEFHTADPVCITNINFQKSTVTTAEIHALDEVTGTVQSIQSFKGGLNVHLIDAHNESVLSHAIFRTGISTTPSVAIAQDDISLTFTSTAGFIVGNKFIITEGDFREKDDIEIITIVGNVITVDRPFDFTYTTAALIEKVDTNMVDSVDVVAGTITAPVIFKVGPPPGEIWHILRMIVSMTHSTGGDDSKFGNLNALTNGVNIRQVLSTRKENISNWKTNNDLKLDMFDVVYEAKAGGGAHSTAGRFTYKANDFVPALDGDLGDHIEIRKQDSIALTSLEMKFGGHKFGK